MREGSQAEPGEAGECARHRGAAEEPAPGFLLYFVCHDCSLVILASTVCTLTVSAPSP